jgi:hypothetical protein
MEDFLITLLSVLIPSALGSICFIAYKHHDVFLKAMKYLYYIPLGVFFIIQLYGLSLSVLNAYLAKRIINSEHLHSREILSIIDTAINDITPSLPIVFGTFIAYGVFLLLAWLVTKTIHSEKNEVA